MLTPDLYAERKQIKGRYKMCKQFAKNYYVI